MDWKKSLSHELENSEDSISKTTANNVIPHINSKLFGGKLKMKTIGGNPTF